MWSLYTFRFTVTGLSNVHLDSHLVVWLLSDHVPATIITLFLPRLLFNFSKLWDGISDLCSKPFLSPTSERVQGDSYSLTRLCGVTPAGSRGLWNRLWLPTAPGRGGADRPAATKLMVSTQDWSSLASLRIGEQRPLLYRKNGRISAKNNNNIKQQLHRTHDPSILVSYKRFVRALFSWRCFEPLRSLERTPLTTSRQIS